MLAGFFVVGVKGKSADDETVDFLRTYKPSGIILFSHNVPENTDELREFIYSLKGKVGYDFFVSVDEEGGRVMRIPVPFELPPPRKLGEMYEEGVISPEDIFSLGEKLGAFLAGLGIDVNYAPLLDLYGYNFSVIGDRAFSKDPAVVALLAESFAKGLFSGGIIPVGKHFPGHSLVREDSHKTLPRSGEISWDEIKKHIMPFRKVANSVFGIMTAHIIVDAFDEKPCTISEKWISELKGFFPGCVITDDLMMGAMRGLGDLHEVSFLSFKAGCDALLICSHEYNMLAKTFEEFEKLVKEERIPQERLHDAAQRIAFLRFKRKF